MDGWKEKKGGRQNGRIDKRITNMKGWVDRRKGGRVKPIMEGRVNELNT